MSMMAPPSMKKGRSPVPESASYYIVTNFLRGRQKKSGLTYLNQQNSVNISAVGAYYTPNQQKFYKDHTELYKFDIGAVIQVENK